MTEVSNSGQDSNAIRQQQFQDSSKILHDSLDGYQKSQFNAQRDEYKEAMKDAFNVLKQTSSSAANSQLQKMKQDMDKFNTDSSPKNLEQLQKDLQQIDELNKE